MEEPAAAAAFPDPPEDPSPSPSSAPSPAAAAPPPGPRELAAAMEAVERDVAAISDSYASLFASLRVALANVRTHSRTRNWTKLPRLLPPSTLRSLLPFLRLASFAARSLRSLIYCSLTLLPQNWILKKKGHLDVGGEHGVPGRRRRPPPRIRWGCLLTNLQISLDFIIRVNDWGEKLCYRGVRL